MQSLLTATGIPYFRCIPSSVKEIKSIDVAHILLSSVKPTSYQHLDTHVTVRSFTSIFEHITQRHCHFTTQLETALEVVITSGDSVIPRVRVGAGVGRGRLHASIAVVVRRQGAPPLLLSSVACSLYPAAPARTAHHSLLGLAARPHIAFDFSPRVIDVTSMIRHRDLQ